MYLGGGGFKFIDSELETAYGNECTLVGKLATVVRNKETNKLRRD
jgi:hypothetical protein